MVKIIDKIEEVIDFVWELCQNDLHASYPRITSMKELKDDIERAIIEDNENIIAYYHQDEICGVCIYFWNCDTKYTQTTGFLIGRDYNNVAEEFISHIQNQCPGYELLIGVPLTNINAIQFFNNKNIECIESSIDTRMYNIKINDNQKHEHVERITESNFQEYAVFHDKYAISKGMYYNSLNLKKDINCFRILVFKQEGKIHGSIFVKIYKDIAEVFGLFVDNQFNDKKIESILINDMLLELYNNFGAIKELIYFINDDCHDELHSALNAGFEIVDKYRCYKLTL